MGIVDNHKSECVLWKISGNGLGTMRRTIKSSYSWFGMIRYWNEDKFKSISDFNLVCFLMDLMHHVLMMIKLCIISHNRMMDIF